MDHQHHNHHQHQHDAVHTPPSTEEVHAHPEAHQEHGETPQQEAMDHAVHGREMEHEGHAHHADHTGHEQLFRQRFWVCLILSIPVLLYNPMLQEWLGFSMPIFPGSQWLAPVLGTIIFFYGGLPF